MRYSLNKTKYLLEPEAQALEITLQKFHIKDLRNVLLIELALKTGARAQEVLNIRRIDLDEHEQTVLILGLKGSSDREIPLPSPLFKRLFNFASQSKTERLFNISYSRFRAIWVLYRPVHKKLHSLRHTFAIRLYRKTKDLRLVQVALGHRNITNTMVYAEYIYSQVELRRLIL